MTHVVNLTSSESTFPCLEPIHPDSAGNLVSESLTGKEERPRE